MSKKFLLILTLVGLLTGCSKPTQSEQPAQQPSGNIESEVVADSVDDVCFYNNTEITEPNQEYMNLLNSSDLGISFNDISIMLSSTTFNGFISGCGVDLLSDKFIERYEKGIYIPPYHMFEFTFNNNFSLICYNFSDGYADLKNLPIYGFRYNTEDSTVKDFSINVPEELKTTSIGNELFTVIEDNYSYNSEIHKCIELKPEQTIMNNALSRFYQFTPEYKNSQSIIEINGKVFDIEKLNAGITTINTYPLITLNILDSLESISCDIRGEYSDYSDDNFCFYIDYSTSMSVPGRIYNMWNSSPYKHRFYVKLNDTSSIKLMDTIITPDNLDSFDFGSIYNETGIRYTMEYNEEDNSIYIEIVSFSKFDEFREKSYLEY